MPGGPDLGSWDVAVAFTDTVRSVSNTAQVPVEVGPSKLHGSFMGPGEMKIFLSLVQHPPRGRSAGSPSRSTPCRSAACSTGRRWTT